jgi:hypothetical protein
VKKKILKVCEKEVNIMVKEQRFVSGRIFITLQSRKGIVNPSKIFLGNNGIKLPYLEEKKS